MIKKLIIFNFFVYFFYFDKSILLNLFIKYHNSDFNIGVYKMISILILFT